MYSNIAFYSKKSRINDLILKFKSLLIIFLKMISNNGKS